MPIYEYRCDNGHLFEVMQKMSDGPVTECETCQAPVSRVFHPVAVHFKGSGFYNTDYGTAKRKREMDSSAKSGADKHDAQAEGEEGLVVVLLLVLVVGLFVGVGVGARRARRARRARPRRTDRAPRRHKRRSWLTATNLHWNLGPAPARLRVMSPRHVGLLAALAAIWGGSYLLIKYALEDLSAPMIVFARCLVASLVLLVALRATTGAAGPREAVRDLRERPRTALLLGTLAVAAPFMLITLGELEVPSGLTAVLISPASIFVAMLAPFLDATERADRRQAVGMVIGLAGVALVVGVESVQTLWQFLGALAMIGAAVFYALSGFVVKGSYKALSAMQTSWISITVATVLTFPAAVATAPARPPRRPRRPLRPRARRGRHRARVRHLLQADRGGRREPGVAGRLPRARRRAGLRRAAARRGDHRGGGRRAGADPRRRRARLAAAARRLTTHDGAGAAAGDRAGAASRPARGKGLSKNGRARSVWSQTKLGVARIRRECARGCRAKFERWRNLQRPLSCLGGQDAPEDGMNLGLLRSARDTRA